jgi:hypothetical protein
VALALLFVVDTLKPHWLAAPPAAALATASAPAPAPAAPVAALTVAPGEGVVSYSQAARRAAPAVVSVVASKAPGQPPTM